MKILRCSLAALATCVATLALTATAAPAAIELVNPGFETGTTAGWMGNGNATRDYAGFSARDGSYFGLVRSPGCPGEQLLQPFAAAAGDVLSGWAFFRTGDTLPFDDHGAVSIVVESRGSSDVVFSASVSQVGDGGATGWKSFSYAIPDDGTYAVQIEVENEIDCGAESAVGIDIPVAATDGDGDGVLDEADNCPSDENAGQGDNDGDAQGDACDADDDDDGVEDPGDNCRLRSNSLQIDTDGDGSGDACDADDDDDARRDGEDNCQVVSNGDQADSDGDGRGDACDLDDDDDGRPDADDNCRLVANPGQADTDADGEGNACDADDDNDAVVDSADNCDTIANTDQQDNDADRRGDACDPDDDGDGIDDDSDNCRFVANHNQRDDDDDGKGNACDGAFDSTVGRATGGGWTTAHAGRVNFSVSATSRRGAVDATCMITVGSTRITCLNADGYHQSAIDDRVVVVGDATIDGVPTRYRIELEDRGEPGRNDRIDISMDSGFQAAGKLGAGNVQIRRA